MRNCVLLAATAASMYAQILPQGIGPGPGPASAAISSLPGGQEEIGPNTVVATVAGISVTLADVRKILEKAPTALVQQFQQNPQQALGQVFLMRYLADEGEKAKLDQKSPLKEEIEDLIALLKQQVLANAMVNQEQNGYLVSDQQIDDFYQKNQSRWEEAKIKIILIGFKPASVAPAKVPTGGADSEIEERLKAEAQKAVETAHPLN
jgi:hypothetical protein